MYYNEKLEKINNQLKILDGGGKAVVWPFGRHTAELFFRSKLSQYSGQIQFVDSRPENRTFLGRAINSPSEIKWEEISYVIVSTLRFQREIALEAASQPDFTGEIIQFYEACEVREFYLLYDERHEISYGGDYHTWEEAEANCAEGYRDKKILEVCIRLINELKDKKLAPDHFCVSHILAACQKQKHIIIVDFGGGLGDEYFMNRFFLERAGIDYVWCIVEQKHYVSWALRELQTDKLRFFQDLDDVKKEFGGNHFIIIIRGSLQYVPDAYAVLDQCIEMRPVQILIDIIPVAEQEHFVIQTTESYLYQVKLPVRIFSESKLIDYFGQQGYLLTEYTEKMETRFSDYNGGHKCMAFELEEKK